MEKCLLSIDWDYFVYTRDNWGSYIENNRSLIDSWYKRYIQAKARSEDIREYFLLSGEMDGFWDRIRNCFTFANCTKAYVSDSHTMSYSIAKENGCRAVFLFDSHSDLGYGGLSSLSFELNCSNWLGKLLAENHISEAHIFYSPYTAEKPEHFKAINSKFNVNYHDLSYLDGKRIPVSAVHICRSGAWTPPWLDDRFKQFVEALGIPYEIKDCPERNGIPSISALLTRYIT
jgi:hypothetical protein